MNFLFDQAEKNRRASRFKSAQRTYQKLLRLPSLDALERAQALLGLADVERIQGFFPDSLRHYRSARLLSRPLDPLPGTPGPVGPWRPGPAAGPGRPWPSCGGP
jgi:tetratricopeptide (TPR) repeat protein